MEQFKYLGTITNQNLIPEEMKSRLRSGNAYFRSVQNVLSCSLLSKNIKIKIPWTIISPILMYWCDTRSLIVRNVGCSCFRTGCWVGCLGLTGKVTGEWRRLQNREVCDLYSSPITTRKIKSGIRWAGQRRYIQGFGQETLWKETTWKT